MNSRTGVDTKPNNTSLSMKRQNMSLIRGRNRRQKSTIKWMISLDRRCSIRKGNWMPGQRCTEKKDSRLLRPRMTMKLIYQAITGHSHRHIMQDGITWSQKGQAGQRLQSSCHRSNLHRHIKPVRMTAIQRLDMIRKHMRCVGWYRERQRKAGWGLSLKTPQMRRRRLQAT